MLGGYEDQNAVRLESPAPLALNVTTVSHTTAPGAACTPRWDQVPHPKTCQQELHHLKACSKAQNYDHSCLLLVVLSHQFTHCNVTILLNPWRTTPQICGFVFFPGISLDARDILIHYVES